MVNKESSVRINAVLSDVIRSLFKRPATERYPFVKQQSPEHLRGKLHWDPEKCSGCCLCMKDCPSKAIEVITIDKANKRFVMRYHEDRCTYCAQCVQNCRFNCIEMSNDQWELASANKEPFTVYYGREADIEPILAKQTQPDVEEPEKV
jgi:formate hydrogenlyase subunit 6/NADH:ubiquinone oxidoreductase subunit I